MQETNAGGRRLARVLAAAAISILGAVSAEATEFYATQDGNGDTVVVDPGGDEVPIAPADPVGERPGACPIDSYYVVEVPTDKSKLVLTDCATGLVQVPVLPGTSGGG